MRAHGSEESTNQIAIRFNVSLSVVCYLRRILHIPSPKSQGGYFSLNNLDKGDIVWKLTQGGLTFADICRQRGYSKSRQNANNVLVNRFGLSVRELEKQRTSEWYARNIAGKDEDLLAKLLDLDSITISLNTISVDSLAGKLGVSPSRMRYYLTKTDIDPALLKGKRANMVELVCSVCQTKFKRDKRMIEIGIKKNPSKKDFYCSKVCQGKNIAKMYGFGSRYKI